MIICTLKAVLDRKGWSRYKLAKKSGISYPSIHALYHNRTWSYDRSVLDQLCVTLRCRPKDLLRFYPKPLRFPRTK